MKDLAIASVKTINGTDNSAAASITRVASGAAQTTSASFSAPTAGDLIVVMAHRDGSTTPPTKVTGYTTIDATAGANTNSAILAFKFSDGTETSTGTWTNATSVAYVIYRNAGLGGWAKTRSAGASTSIAYGTLTMQNTSGSSWVVGFGGHRTATDVATAPTGMTNLASASDIAVHDTGAGVASWSNTSATVNANSGWVSYTLEIMAVPSGQLLWTLIQAATTTGIASATTAAVTLTQSVGSEPHVLLVTTQYSANPVEVVSIDKGGTLIPIVATSGGDNSSHGTSCGYVIGTTTATSPITVTFAGTTGGCNITIWEVAYTGTGTPALDFANQTHAPSGTSVSGPAFTMSGGNDFVAHTAATDNNVTAVSSPYNSPTGYSTFPSGNGFAAAFNQTSITTPTWTISATGKSGLAGVGFGLNPTAFQQRGFVDFEASSDGTTATAALLKASTRGWSAGVWTTGGSGAAMKFEADASRGLTNSIARLCDGASYAAGAGSLGVQFLTSTVQSYLKWEWATGSGLAVNATSFSAGVWFWSDIPDGSTSNIDVFALQAPSGTNFANCKFLSNGSAQRAFELEITGGSSGATVRVPPSNWYWLSLQFNKTGSHVLKVYDASLNLLGTLTEAHTGTGMPGNLVMGQSSSNTPTTGYVVNFDSVLVDPSGSYPLLP